MTTYIIKKTDTHTLCEIADGTADTISSSLVLFGKNYAGYGPQLDENFVKLLENFSFSSPPIHPVQGQLWWDTSSKSLKVYTLAEWKVISGPHFSTIPPDQAQAGDLWWDSDHKQLNVYSGTGWVLVGPLYNSSQGVSGTVPATVTGSSDHVSHIVIKFYVKDVVVAVLSNDPTFSTTDIPGFADIKPGFNLPTSYGQYSGDAENALRLGNVLAANFLRSDVVSTTNFKLNVKSNDGISIGLNDDMTVAVDASAVKFSNNTLGRDTEFYVKGTAGLPVLGLKIENGTGIASVPLQPATATAIANKEFVDSSIAAASADYLLVNGGNQVKGSLLPDHTGVYSIGSAATKFRDVFATNLVGDVVTANTAVFDSIQISSIGTAPESAVSKQYVDTADLAVTTSTDAKLVLLRNQIVNNAPANLSTLNALAQSIGGSSTFYTDVETKLALKAPLASPNFTGTPIAPTVSVGDISGKIATTAFVHTAVGNVTSSINNDLIAYAKIESPTLTGATTVEVLNVGTGIFTATNGAIDIGTPANQFRNVYGTSITAKYADLAENYVADAYYEPGTVLDFGGEKEVTLSSGKDLTKVAGVVSSNPAYLMNSECAGEFVVALALQGRVPCKVIGQIAKGDLLVSYGGGVARRHLKPDAGTLIGKALEAHAGEESVIEIVVGRC